MKAVRVLAVADASALPRLRRALSPESIELVAVASTPASALAQLRRMEPDVVVVDLGLLQSDVFQLISQLVQEPAVAVLALASGDEAASLAERARDAGASDVVERRGGTGSWHEESGSPHVLSLRVLAVAAAAKPRPSKLSLRLSRPAGSARLPLSAADLPGAPTPTPGRSRASPIAPASSGAESSSGAGFGPGAPPSQNAAGRSHGTVSTLPTGSSSMPALGAPQAQSAVGLSQGAVCSSQATPGPPPMAAATAQVVRTGASGAPQSAAPASGAPRAGQPLRAAQVELVALGASTGGTSALAELLRSMPRSAPPMLVVQHMLPEFTNDFAERLNELCDMTVRVAVDGELVESGSVLLAPGGRHLRVMRDTERRLRVRVTDEPPVGKHRPSVDVLFQACAETIGSAAVGVLLTGMGDDGARGLLALHKAGARTLVQDQASSVCFGMPSAAIALGAAQQVLPLRDIAHALRELVKRDSARA